MGMIVKTYVVQTADDKLVDVKLTRGAAQAVAKDHAPAKVTLVVADKLPELDVQGVASRKTESVPEEVLRG